LLLAHQSGLQPVLDEALPHLLDRGAVDLDGFGNAGVSPSRPLGGGIGFEQDAGVGQFLGSGLAGGDQIVQGLPFVGSQRNLVLLHGGILPVPPKNRDAAALGKSKLSSY
jgi:hypothetical protein